MKVLIKYYLIPLFFLCSFTLEAKKEWVQVKPRFEYEAILLINCFDSLNCYSLTEHIDRIELYHSTDQGKNWNKILVRMLRNDEFIWDVLRGYMTNPKNVYLTYFDRVVLEVSENGGKDFEVKTFGKLSENPNDRFDGLAFYDENISVGLTNRNRFIFTENNWSSYRIAYIPEEMNPGKPVFFLDSNNIVFARYDRKNKEYVKYNKVEKSFSTWSDGYPFTEMHNELITGIDFVNDTLVYACGLRFFDTLDFSNGIIWKSTDKGRNWKKLMDTFNLPGYGLNDIAFRNENHGIAMSNSSTILETTDGGESWFQYPVRQDMKGGGTITWAGSYALYSSRISGIYRLETITDVEELSSDEKFRVYQSGRNLEIAINDPTHSQYSFELYSQTGQQLLSRSVTSAYGFIFQPVELIELTNGAYFYTISSSTGVEFSGKLVVSK